jgi:hypothetical protein
MAASNDGAAVQPEQGLATNVASHRERDCFRFIFGAIDSRSVAASQKSRSDSWPPVMTGGRETGASGDFFGFSETRQPPKAECVGVLFDVFYRF